uniref:Uncharacterized protein n=1 Tax=Morchella brunnea TaxID=1174671 RepID=A0A8K1I7Z4_9PEZI|nr:hypothetical protein LK370_mgp017 [Morchella brunnea]UBU98410.1 hypothetical protein [Morchella brunnea]
MSPSVPLPLALYPACTTSLPPPTTALIPRGRNMLVGPGISRWERKAPSCTCPLSVADCMSMYTFPSLDLVLHLLFLLLFDPPPPRLGIGIPRTKCDKKRDIHTRGIQGIGARYRYTCPCRQTLGTRQRGTPDLFPVSSQILRSKPYPCLGVGLAFLIPFLRSGFLYSFLDPFPTIQALPPPLRPTTTKAACSSWMRGKGLGVHAQLRYSDFRTLVGIQGHRKAWLWRVFPTRPAGYQRALPLSPCGIGHTTSGRLCFLEASPIPHWLVGQNYCYNHLGAEAGSIPPPSGVPLSKRERGLCIPLSLRERGTLRRWGPRLHKFFWKIPLSLTLPTVYFLMEINERGGARWEGVGREIIS